MPLKGVYLPFFSSQTGLSGACIFYLYLGFPNITHHQIFGPIAQYRLGLVWKIPPSMPKLKKLSSPVFALYKRGFKFELVFLKIF
ncbi:MAG: hypothetical protein H0A76_05760 [Candidatus Thiodubiliella endoseptemdiera]|uniref:Uncharacterized protein n=1 Tax=Candidatus Thiodubiliella endoseptemdiera TaxID=2738886 RepID=A0A853F0Q8_9GAMM|nr:hypothetical protein [Candidatus Thiodubiliella endoseptemdiera]